MKWKAFPAQPVQVLHIRKDGVHSGFSRSLGGGDQPSAGIVQLCIVGGAADTHRRRVVLAAQADAGHAVGCPQAGKALLQAQRGLHGVEEEAPRDAGGVLLQCIQRGGGSPDFLRLLHLGKIKPCKWNALQGCEICLESGAPHPVHPDHVPAGDQPAGKIGPQQFPGFGFPVLRNAVLQIEDDEICLHDIGFQQHFGGVGGNKQQ